VKNSRGNNIPRESAYTNIREDPRRLLKLIPSLDKCVFSWVFISNQATII